MSFSEWIQLAALVLLAVAIAWSTGIALAASGFGWPVAIGVLGVGMLSIAGVLERWSGGGDR